jgi:alkyldihydroxyacetonephosphate synthase
VSGACVAFAHEKCNSLSRYKLIAESFETSVPWTNILSLCKAVKEEVVAACKDEGVVQPPFISCRVTQVYDTGACVYFYLGFMWTGLPDPVRAFSEVEDRARLKILECGGSLSHHHGVGKHRRKYMQAAVSDAGMHLLRGLKATVDPHNVFAAGNLNL